MKGKIITLKFADRQGFLIPGIPISFEPKLISDHLATSTSTAYWRIRILSHFKEAERIFVEVVGYSSSEDDFVINQIANKDFLMHVKTISFRGFNTLQLYATLGRPKVARTPKQFVIKPHEPKKGIIPETFAIPIKKLRFKNGCVSFEKKLSWMWHSEELQIANPDIRPEFDAIKDYFANVLGTKKIQVKVVTHTLDEDITSIEIESPEIGRITGNLIESVKLGFISKTIRNSGAEMNKSLFSIDEFFNEFGEKFKPDVFYDNEQKFIEDLIAISNSKHYNQLRFLSKVHSFETMKLQFVPKPISFVFLIPGEVNNHLVWETLDTEEATYVWRTPNDSDMLNAALKNLESAICEIKSGGKLEFLRKGDENFDRIYHDYSDEDEGFVKWKTDLEKLMNQ